MSSGGDLVLGSEIRLGAFVFLIDDSAWLQEAPLDVEALPVHGAMHFSASSCGVLLRQPSTPYMPAPASSGLPAVRRRKRSGRSRLQRWVRHAAARQASTPQIAALEPAESFLGLSESASDPSGHSSECESCDPAAEVFMAGSHQSPPGYGRGGGERGGPSTDHQRRDEEVLQTPIVGASAEAQALEAARIATLAERARLEEMERALDGRTRQRQLFPPVDNNRQVYRTPIQNLAAAARIADSIQPSDSEAGRGLEQIRTLLGAARQQNSAVS